MNIFGGMKKLWIFLGVSLHYWANSGGGGGGGFISFANRDLANSRSKHFGLILYNKPYPRG